MMLRGCCAPPSDMALESVDQVTAKPIDIPLEKPLWMLEAEDAEVAAKKRMEEMLVKRAEEAAAREAKAKAKRDQDEAQAAETAKAEAEEAAVTASASPKKKATAKRAPKSSAAAASVPLPEPKDMTNARYELEVKIVSAANLRNADWIAGTSDPYCLCESTGVCKARFRTKVVDDKTDPVWNQAAKLTIAHGEAINFTVNDKDQGKSDDLLGWVELPFTQMLPTGFEGELKLKDASDSAKAQNATIKVRVKMLRSFTADGAVAKEEAPPAKAAPKVAAKAKAKPKQDA
ncbi:unnamed protein product [Polarella glacialis]|uniref:C2 domain-containing protein n=2 Tax=Polarella glacialis TaxID=89957 RepID=A0A813F744_POLGL|nr:unnamed protein product [Polarella glacialis]